MIQESRVKDQPRTSEVHQPVLEREDAMAKIRPSGLTRVTWSAVIAGTVAAISAQVLFATLGLAIGLSLPGATGAEGVGIFAGIWWLVTGLVALFIGGWVAGRFTGVANELDASLHGVMTWALATTLSVLFVTAFGGMLASGAVGAIADDITPRQGQAQIAPMSQAAQPTQQQPVAMPPAEDLADSAAGAAWWTFFALLLGLVAAGAGGFIATPRDAGHSTTMGAPRTSTPPARTP